MLDIIQFAWPALVLIFVALALGVIFNVMIVRWVWKKHNEEKLRMDQNKTRHE